MYFIEARNVHEAIPRAFHLLKRHGVRRASRNGPVLVVPAPVATQYAEPCERVIFWPQRDANPSFHLYESMWMLLGRNDVEPLTRYVSRFKSFSDDGRTLAGAYGDRWRQAFGRDQLALIVERLRANPDDRRAVLQIWDSRRDLGSNSVDVPCNLVATFQIDEFGLLNMTVFCRSNDIVWGCYGANAVHFSMLQEYLATWIGCHVGWYCQVSVNWHAYEDTLDLFRKIPSVEHSGLYSVPLTTPDESLVDPYTTKRVIALPLANLPIAEIDRQIAYVVHQADYHYADDSDASSLAPYFFIIHKVLKAHYLWRTLAAPERYDRAIDELPKTATWRKVDWVVAMEEWIERRRAQWEARMRQETPS